MADYGYQIHSAHKILNDAIKPSIEAAVLAGVPGSGKTTISQIAINEYLKKFPNHRVLVLTHGQNLLKNQYLDSLKNPHVNIDFTFGDFLSDHHISPQVFVGIPHSIHHLPVESIDLLVVDECHEFYLKPMVQNIVKKLQPKHQMLLTGSPSKFNKLKKEGRKFEMTYISGEELMKKDVFSDVILSVIPVNYKKNARISLQTMYEQALLKGRNLSKIMVAVRNIKEANNAAYYLRSIGRNVAISNCKNDRNNILVEQFKKGEYDTLVVVQRGILGFSDNNITGLFDLRCSNDVDISNQLFARVLRKHPNGVKKFYYRCGNKKTKDYNNQVAMLYKVKSLMDRYIFINYDGENMKARAV